MRILALDPGERVGWARADVAEDGTWTDLRHGITPLKDMALAMHSSKLGAYDLVVVEDWRLYPGEAQAMIGSSFPSVQFIGMVRLLCWTYNRRLVMQGASIKKVADKSMAALRPDLHELVTRPIKHDDGHDLDALRHLWFWCFKNCAVTPAQEAA